jgi:hypothetical protein
MQHYLIKLNNNKIQLRNKKQHKLNFDILIQISYFHFLQKPLKKFLISGLKI